MQRSVPAVMWVGVLCSAVMNEGGLPYGISNGVKDAKSPYKADFGGLGESFDVYGGVQTRYSQVYWTRNDPVPLPAEIVQRFKGKVMAITGYEVDQVMRTPSGDMSIPSYHAYNHHYFGWLMGADSEMVTLKEPKFIPNPTFSEARDLPSAKSGYPTNIVFKENPGGEFRKSYHGYPKGYAQLLHSPKDFIVEPMQIDTHNRRDSPSATNASGFKPWFWPKSVEGNVDPHTRLNPLIECPCSDRISRVLVNSSAVLDKGVCPKPLTSLQSCAAAAATAAPLAGPAEAVRNASLPAGCILLPSPSGYRAVFNSAASKIPCGGSGPASSAMEGEAKSLVTLNVAVDKSGVRLKLSGPDGAWFAVGFDATQMADEPYAVVVSGSGAVTERKLANHGPGTLLKPSVVVVSDSVEAGVRTVELTRAIAGVTPEHYTFPTTPGELNFINAVGKTPELSYHKARTGASVTLLPSETSSCLCEPTSTPYIEYMSGKSKDLFNIDCLAEPRSDMAQQHNPACRMATYHGGLRCCKHQFFLTDRAQETLIPEEVDSYFLKWRFYFQEYVPAGPGPASHQHIHHWVFLIDANVNDYEEVTCGDDGTCERAITARLTGAQMGLEDTPANFSGIVPVVMTPHCHAPSCIRQDLINADTGELLCSVTGRYGQSEAVFDEADYIALSPCLFGHEPGLRSPPVLRPETNLLAVKVFNSTFRHMGQMAQWTGLMVYSQGQAERAEAKSGPEVERAPAVGSPAERAAVHRLRVQPDMWV